MEYLDPYRLVDSGGFFAGEDTNSYLPPFLLNIFNGLTPSDMFELVQALYCADLTVRSVHVIPKRLHCALVMITFIILDK